VRRLRLISWPVIDIYFSQHTTPTTDNTAIL
jgi:hypothetical protein